MLHHTLKSGRFPALLFLVLSGQLASAQVPHLLHYQGRVSAQGTNYHGVGQFKFALVDPGSNLARQATATASIVNGFIVSVTVLDAGAGYTTAPAVTVSDPTGFGALFRANLVNGSVNSISILNAGLGYSAPVLTIAAPAGNVVHQTYWSQDGTSWQGGEPAGAVSLPVSQGLFSLLLGDTNLTGMQPLTPAAFDRPDVRLRVWFSPGSGVFTRLTPDQRIAAVGYAMMAETVPDGSITQGKLAPGSVGALQLADGSITAAKLATNSGVGAPQGSIVMAANPQDTNLLAAGYTRLPTASFSSERWETVPLQNAHLLPIDEGTDPFESPPKEVVGGDTLVVWYDQTQRGIFFNAISNAWFPVTTENAPSSRSRSAAVWTSRGMFVWGGYDSNGTYLTTGAIFDPRSNRWTTLPTNGAPSARYNAVVAWTGGHVIIWGGVDPISWDATNSGTLFNLSTQQWTPISQVGAPNFNDYMLSVWTGTELFISSQVFDIATRYNPSLNLWRSVSSLTSDGGSDYTPYGYVSIAINGQAYGWTPRGGEIYSACYDPDNDTWRRIRWKGPLIPPFLSEPPLKRMATRSQVQGNLLFLLPFAPPDSPEQKPVSLYRYDSTADFWTVLPCNQFVGALPEFLLTTGNSFTLVSLKDPSLALRYTPGQPLYLYEKR